VINLRLKKSTNLLFRMEGLETKVGQLGFLMFMKQTTKKMVKCH
jgi:hypothetical protein